MTYFVMNHPHAITWNSFWDSFQFRHYFILNCVLKITILWRHFVTFNFWYFFLYKHIFHHDTVNGLLRQQNNWIRNTYTQIMYGRKTLHYIRYLFIYQSKIIHWCVSAWVLLIIIIYNLTDVKLKHMLKNKRNNVWHIFGKWGPEVFFKILINI